MSLLNEGRADLSAMVRRRPPDLDEGRSSRTAVSIRSRYRMRSAWRAATCRPASA